MRYFIKWFWEGNKLAEEFQKKETFEQFVVFCLALTFTNLIYALHQEFFKLCFYWSAAAWCMPM